MRNPPRALRAFVGLSHTRAHYMKYIFIYSLFATRFFTILTGEFVRFLIRRNYGVFARCGSLIRAFLFLTKQLEQGIMWTYKGIYAKTIF
ncbi:MAG TPA: hypothetical protein DEF59_03610 [Candidatus Magasanikbacteria bacterium]|nr:hypothetical protein [Candidatus Magasanikbacteria bacterium]